MGDSKMDLVVMYLNIYFGLVDWDKILNFLVEFFVEDFWGLMCVEYGLENKMLLFCWLKFFDSVLFIEIGN